MFIDGVYCAPQEVALLAKEMLALPAPNDRYRKALLERSDGATLKEVGEALGVSQERARQMVAIGARQIREEESKSDPTEIEVSRAADLSLQIELAKSRAAEKARAEAWREEQARAQRALEERIRAGVEALRWRLLGAPSYAIEIDGPAFVFDPHSGAQRVECRTVIRFRPTDQMIHDRTSVALIPFGSSTHFRQIAAAYLVGAAYGTARQDVERLASTARPYEAALCAQLQRDSTTAKAMDPMDWSCAPSH